METDIMGYETKFTRLTPAADLSLESIELQIQQKMELEQLEQYLKENHPQETELHEMNPEALLEAYGSEMLHAISINRLRAEKERKDREADQ